jgi:hypothetical protein
MNMTARKERNMEYRQQDAALGVRVDALAGDIAGVKRDVHELRGTMASRADVLLLAQKMDDLSKEFINRNRPNWQPIVTAIGVGLSICVAIGTLAYWPITTQLANLQELTSYRQRTEVDRLVPRREVDLLRQLYDTRVSFNKEKLDELNRKFDSIVTPRDSIEDINRRLDRLQNIVVSPLFQEEKAK